MSMRSLYIILAAVHLFAVAVTGMLWTYYTLRPNSALKQRFRDFRAVHFGSLYLTPIFLGLAWALDTLNVPEVHWVPFPAGLGLLVFFAGIAWLFPLPKGTDPFYYWTQGTPMVFSLIGLGCLVVALCWTAGVLVVYAM